MKCQICQNSKKFKNLKPQFSKSSNYLCENCGLVFITRNKVHLQDYYKQGGYFNKSPNIAYKKQLISRSLLIHESEQRVVSALDIFSPNLKGKSVLDVGCGYGEILHILKTRFGCYVEGVEPSVETAKIGSDMFSLKIHPILLEELKTEEKYDLIWSSHVLEHTSDPNSFLKKVKSLLKKGGDFYLEVPNALKPTGGFPLDMFFYKEHLQTFSSYNLYLLLKKKGFSVIAYSDSGFLKFWCKLPSSQGLVPSKISSEEILTFLRKYKRDYNYISLAKVYAQKALYVAKIALYKTGDIFGK
ncbi:MAG: methyltransferase family protein [Microgenomates group bacterium Gr01-1014_5]|nr:MAG: methyltransferase family protein [Microgenomates group bacterium Gr01-1014_5]